jgi:hypothetical protein
MSRRTAGRWPKGKLQSLRHVARALGHPEVFAFKARWRGILRALERAVPVPPRPTPNYAVSARYYTSISFGAPYRHGTIDTAG